MNGRNRENRDCTVNNSNSEGTTENRSCRDGISSWKKWARTRSDNVKGAIIDRVEQHHASTLRVIALENVILPLVLIDSILCDVAFFSDDKPNLAEANQTTGRYSSERSRDQVERNFRRGLPARELQNKDRGSVFLDWGAK